MEKENIYKVIDRLRTNRVDFIEIEKQLLSAGYENEKIEHAIKYTKADEKRNLYLLSLEYDNFSYFSKKLLNIFGMILGVALLIASIYFFNKFVQVIKTPDIIKKEKTIIIINGMWKGKLTISLFAFGLLTLFSSFFSFGNSLKSYRDIKEKRLNYLKLKARQ